MVANQMDKNDDKDRASKTDDNISVHCPPGSWMSTKCIAYGLISLLKERVAEY